MLGNTGVANQRTEQKIAVLAEVLRRFEKRALQLDAAQVRAMRKTAMAAQGVKASRGSRQDVAAARNEIKALWNEARALDRDAAREVANAERLIVDRAEVVLATCVGANHPILGENIFDCVVIDEATHAETGWGELMGIVGAHGQSATLRLGQQEI